ncbi:TetR-like C-terminal domain-containing protein [Dactylosporangium sp. AC04546]|uniref:TetR/AcrR family transcriptional regulator n=1 Tax=Dactylosporangium sp. AC04546 TaxID=2862460 RepID=UPI002E7B4BE3|nr:TetR-like C-terminal domain-containing protein [Dactylosporangium sp. AC04546]WVK80963.1 TetR-like C-terminal domain-containing protein [Dactylosporangium sp. AC04546]
MPRAGLTQSRVVDTAIAIVDEHGLAALTLAAVAERCGVAAPSLYKHVRNVADLRALVGIRVMQEMADGFAAAVLGRSGADAVAALMRAYRAYVTAHPARYAAMPADPLHQAEYAASGRRVLEVMQAALRPWQLGESELIHTIRAARAIVHGFASLEAAGGFGLPHDLDESYERLIRMFLATLPAL